MPEGLDVGTRGGDLWYLECPALVGDVVYGEEPGSRGRVHTRAGPRSCTARPGSQCRFVVGGSTSRSGDATRVWDTVDVSRAMSHNHCLEPGTPRNGLWRRSGH